MYIYMSVYKNVRKLWVFLRGRLSKILRLISDQKIDFALTLPIDNTWWPSSEIVFCLQKFFLLRKCLKCLVGIVTRHSWDADWSHVGNLETLIGSLGLYSDHVLNDVRSTSLAKLRLACQVGPFYLTFTQINSEINCIAKNKCPDSQ